MNNSREVQEAINQGRPLIVGFVSGVGYDCDYPTQQAEDHWELQLPGRVNQLDSQYYHVSHIKIDDRRETKGLTQQVKAIIETALATAPRVSRYFIAEEIKNSISHIALINAALGAGKSTGDGIANFNAGAKVILQVALKRLWKYYTVSDGWITRKVKTPTKLRDC